MKHALNAESLDDKAFISQDANNQSDKASLPDKDVLTRNDIDSGIKTYEENNKTHNALETPEGKNNGAIPAAFSGQKSNHP